MEVLVERCAGLDVHKKTVCACVRLPGATPGERDEEVRTFKTFTSGLAALADWLGERGVTQVVMESTGVFWKPVWHMLEDRFELLLVNARHAHNVPGRKTDVADAAWLARLGECGLLRASFVPGADQRRLRDLTRYRRRLIEAETREEQRLTKVLEDAGIKLNSVASRTLTVSGRRMVEALCAGERDPEALAEMALRKLRNKRDELQLALVGRFNQHHGLMCRMHLAQIDDLKAGIARLDTQLAREMEPLIDQHQRLCTIPGVADRTAEVIIAEIGVDMARFPTAGHLTSWAGMCPGNNESAGKHGSGRTRPGDKWLRSSLAQAAWAAARTKDTYLGAQFWRIAKRRGQNKAAVAVGHSILVAAYHMLKDNVDYRDLGGDWFVRRNDQDTRRRWLVSQLEAMGHTVTLKAATN